MHKIRRILVRIFLWFFGIVLFLVVALGFGGWLFKDKIIGRVVGELNQYVTSPVNVEKVSLSLFRNFPKASVVFHNIQASPNPAYVQTRQPEGGKPGLFNFATVSFSFSPLELFSNRLLINELVLENGYANVFVDKNGVANYTIFRIPETANSSGGDLNIDLKLFKIKNTQFCWLNESKRSEVLLFVPSAEVKGTMEGKNLRIATRGDINLLSFRSGELRYHPSVPARMKADVAFSGDTLQIRQAGLTSKELAVNASGFVLTGDKKFVQVKVNSSTHNMNSIIDLLPAKEKTSLEGIKASGQFAVSVLFSGAFSRSLSPQIEALFQWTKGGLNSKKYGIDITEAELYGQYNNGKKRHAESGVFQITKATGKLNGGFFSITGKLNNFIHPYIVFDANVQTNADRWATYLKKANIEQATGKLEASVKLNGAVNNAKFTPENLLTLTRDIRIRLENFGMVYSPLKLDVKSVNSTINVDNHTTTIHSFTGKIDGSEVFFNGRADNLPEALQKSAGIIPVNGQINIDSLDVDYWMAKFKTEGESTNKKESAAVELNLDVRTSVLKYDKTTARKVQGRLQYSDKQVGVSNLKASVWEGNIDANVLYVFQKSDISEFRTTGSFSNINLKQLFYAFDNFKLSNLSYQQLEGKATGSAQCEFQIKNGAVQVPSIEVLGHFELEKGRLKQFEPFMELGDFTGIPEFNDLKFDKISNDLMISNSKLFIPTMNIGTNAFDVELYGNQSFDGPFEYHLKLFLADVTVGKARRLKKEQDEYYQANENGDERVKLFLLATNDGKKTHISLDRKAVGNNMKQSLQKQKQEMKEILKEDFGLFKKDTTLNKKQEKKKPKFEIEWDEE